MKIDMHNHTNASSDSISSVEELIKWAKEKKIDAIAITDHNTIKNNKKAEEIGKKFDVTIIPGEEITTADGDLIALYLTEEIKPYMSFEETLDEIKSQGALAYAPHPFDNKRKSLRKEEFLKKCHIIEVHNAKATEEDDLKAFEFSKANNMLKGCGSDSHSPYEVGRAYLEIENADISTPERFLKSIRNANYVIEKRTSLFEKVVRKAKISIDKIFKNKF